MTASFTPAGLEEGAGFRARVVGELDVLSFNIRKEAGLLYSVSTFNFFRGTGHQEARSKLVAAEDLLRSAGVLLLEASSLLRLGGSKELEGVKEIDRIRAGLLEITAMGEEPFNRQSVRAREILLSVDASHED
jgi:hypothetical protein